MEAESFGIEAFVLEEPQDRVSLKPSQPSSAKDFGEHDVTDGFVWTHPRLNVGSEWSEGRRLHYEEKKWCEYFFSFFLFSFFFS